MAISRTAKTELSHNLCPFSFFRLFIARMYTHIYVTSIVYIQKAIMML